MEGALANITVNMTYYNPRDANPIECAYELPLELKTLLSSLQIKVGDSVIEATVREKEQAQQKYEDAVASGELGLLAEKVTVGE